MRKKKVTLVDVARGAGVSVPTASAVLGGRADEIQIAQATRKRVRAAAKKIGYRPNIHARRLRALRTRVIGVLVAHLGDIWYGMYLNELDRALLKTGYSMLLATGENRPGRYEACLHLLEENSVDGVIFVGGALPVKKLVEQVPDLPSVWIGGDPQFRGTTILGADPEQAARLIVEHLVEAGHKRFGYVGFSSRQTDSRVRLAFIRRVLSKYSLDIETELIKSVASLNSSKAGYHGAKRLLARCPEITALIGFDDNIALGAIQAAAEQGLKVGVDLSITGFDDNPYAAFATPTLTSIRCSIKETASLALTTVLSMVETKKPRPKGPLWLPCELVVRDSTGKPSRRTRKNRRTT